MQRPYLGRVTTPPAERFAEDRNWRRTFLTGSGGVRLHVVEAGPVTAEPVVLLHGFPEFWYAWRHVMAVLIAEGVRAFAPDLRGYNLSGQPPRVVDYHIDRLVDDVVALIRHMGGRATLVGHDWGGIVAWYVGMRRPDVLRRLVILNAPHPAAYRRELGRGVGQWARSAYVGFFQLPWAPEAAIRAGNFRLLRRMLRRDPATPDAFTAPDLDRYAQALARGQSLTSALNYYRAFVRDGGRLLSESTRIDVPTLVLWGNRDRYLRPALADGLERWVPNVRVQRFADATHWLHRERPADMAGEILAAVRQVPSPTRF